MSDYESDSTSFGGGYTFIEFKLRQYLLLYLLAFIVCLTVAQPSVVIAQENTEVDQAIARLESGEIAAVKQMLPGLATKYQNDAGVLYLQGRLSVSGNEAKQYYQTIVSNFPKSEWADDALYRLYQYNYAMGLYRTANAQLEQLAKEYPGSPYVKSIPRSEIPKADKPLSDRKETTVRSKEEVTDRKQQEPAKPPMASPQEKFTLQVGAFSTSVNADKLKESFEEKGYTVEVANKVQGGKSLYKVWVGAYTSRTDAEKASKEIKTKFGLSSMVIERF